MLNVLNTHTKTKKKQTKKKGTQETFGGDRYVYYLYRCGFMGA